MITLYSGTPGAGKSLHLAEVLYYRVKNYKGVVIGNFDLNTGNIKGKKHKGKYISIDNNRLTPDRLIQFSQRYRKHYYGSKPMPEGKFLLVIDEIYSFVCIFHIYCYKKKIILHNFSLPLLTIHYLLSLYKKLPQIYHFLYNALL